jgi:hypothetical protein
MFVIIALRPSVRLYAWTTERLFMIFNTERFYWNLLTPCSWTLLEKPPVAQLLMKCPTFYGTRRFITVFTRALHWSLPWSRSIRSIPPHPIYLRSILVLSSHVYIFLVVSFLMAFPLKSTMHSSSPHACYIYLPTYLPTYPSIHLSTYLRLYSPLLDLARFLSFFNFYTVGRTPCTGDQPVARPVPAHRIKQTQHKLTQTSMPQVRLEPMIPAFEGEKTVHALHRTATVIGIHNCIFN